MCAGKKLPDAIDIWLVSDNALTYQNNLLPLIAPFIARSHSFHLRGLIQSEMARGKRIDDDHFVITLRQVYRYNKEMGEDVSTPEDLIVAMDHEPSVPN